MPFSTDPTIFLKAEVIIENDIAPTNGIVGEVILSNVQENCSPYVGTLIAHLHSKPCSVSFGSEPYQDPLTNEELIYTMDVNNGFQGGKAFFDQRTWTVPDISLTPSFVFHYADMVKLFCCDLTWASSNNTASCSDFKYSSAYPITVSASVFVKKAAPVPAAVAPPTSSAAPPRYNPSSIYYFCS